jgi:hypothetical protein
MKFIMYVNVGAMPMSKVETHLSDIMKEFTRAFGEEFAKSIAYIPVRDQDTALVPVFD